MHNWIEWKGGQIPVDPDCFVDTIDRDGSKVEAAKAGNWDWEHLGKPNDIVWYRKSKL